MLENRFEKEKSGSEGAGVLGVKGLRHSSGSRKSGRGIALPWTLADVGIPASRILKGGESDPFCVSLLGVCTLCPLWSSCSLLPRPWRDEHIRSRAEVPRRGAKGRTTPCLRVRARAHVCTCHHPCVRSVYICIRERACARVHVHSPRECRSSCGCLRVCTAGYCDSEWEMKSKPPLLTELLATGDAKSESLYPRCIRRSRTGMKPRAFISEISNVR